jgi:adenosylcobinamide-GDP ribazoletransferase
MLQFLTRIPIRVDLKATSEDYGKGLIFAPVVGLVIGGVLCGSYLLLDNVFPKTVTSVFILVIYIFMTGGLHIDGLGDTFDGLFSNRSKERILEIMRDSRVGTNAVIAIVSVLLINWSVIAALDPEHTAVILLLFPVAGRIGSLVGSGVSVYARSGEGLGKSFIDCCGLKEIMLGIIPYALIFFTAAGLKGLLTSIIPVISAFLLVKLFSLKIGGATGDILGAVCELNQMVFLISAYVIFR